MLTGFGILLLTLTAGIIGVFLLSVTASRPAHLGLHDGRLANCPDSPNCVSTQAEDREHWIAPFTFQQDSNDVMDVLETIVRQQSGTRVIEKSKYYMHVEFRSALFRFVDDVEFCAEPETNRIHFRSASRVGRSDLGVNRKRMELIRGLFQTTESAETPLPGPAGKQAKLQPAR